MATDFTRYITASRLCDCGSSGETTVQYFLNCKMYNEFGLQQVNNFELLCEDNCDEMEKLLLETWNFRKDEEV